MLTFLFVASKAGFVVSSYADDAVGTLTKNEDGSYWVSQVTLRPRVEYVSDAAPAPEQESDLHRLAHEKCTVANSVKSDVRVEPSRA
jgi:organic hydroperoxide reductase OsmC/OhrA